ncbi:hypothetical protein M427DRAFT_65746 [Gonapodya prolifera JEL478]|uniref:DNA2/NAM7 helicase helicase domain-containing protein n=1 Tax=Gonapodya prolifera (strain JEL478) TaxID=1344416 RepID=A0A139AYM4_GONPJ|nr:hypothetical protein M427DRAFT_65746 [Gonapodya prolifera JEL478]|eukprot:KXS21804.1 hypothetical protein M427DRAFT_65746 [Gonapodya prolifera JEL478]
MADDDDARSDPGSVSAGAGQGVGRGVTRCRSHHGAATRGGQARGASRGGEGDAGGRGRGNAGQGRGGNEWGGGRGGDNSNQRGGRGWDPRGRGDGRGGGGHYSGHGRGYPGGGGDRGGRGDGRGSWNSGGRGRGADGTGGQPWRGYSGRGGGRGAGFGPSGAGVSGTEAVHRFIKLMRYAGHDIARTIESSRGQWNACWMHARHLSPDELRALLTAVATIPYSAHVEAPPLAGLSEAFDVFNTQTQSVRKSDPTAAMGQVEIVFNAVRTLRTFTWDVDGDQVRHCLSNALDEGSSALKSSIPDHRILQEKINGELQHLERPWSIKTKSKDAEEAVAAQASSFLEAEGTSKALIAASRWKDANIGWLSNSRLFQPPRLPIFHVPGTKTDGFYKSPEEYFETVLPVWTGLTFQDGNSALISKCKWKDPASGKDCGHVLWPVEEHVRRGRCRTRGCENSCSEVCSNPHHNSGLCTPCADKVREQLRGPPGPGASTHLYDGTVNRLDHDDQVWLVGIASRRPPQQPIHWKTTARLASPNLVGVVKVAYTGAGLRMSDRIFWAEVKQHSFSGQPEFEYRERGQLVVALIHQEGSAEKYFQKGDTVVVIDCLTFAPEFVPVLNALEQLRLFSVPFRNGALLHMAAGLAESTEEEAVSDQVRGAEALQLDVSDDDMDQCVVQMLRDSQLIPIVHIRRYLMDLKTRLIALLKSATLDEKQLDAFIQGFINPVHLTQGPPGTGKSYFGVVMVRALLIVRELWIASDPSVGQPPILVLSYKNHAIDEFMKDLVTTEASVKHNPFRRGNFNSVVRIGSGSKDPILQPYTEGQMRMTTPQVTEAKKNLLARHTQLKEYSAAREKLNGFIELKIDMLAAEDEKVRRQASYKLAQFLGNSITLLNVMKDRVEDDAWKRMVELASKGILRDDSISEINFWMTGKDKDEDDDQMSKAAVELLWTSPLEGQISKAENSRLSGILGQLYQAIRHMELRDGEWHPQEVLWKWIGGFQPRPQRQCCWPLMRRLEMSVRSTRSAAQLTNPPGVFATILLDQLDIMFNSGSSSEVAKDDEWDIVADFSSETKATNVAEFSPLSPFPSAGRRVSSEVQQGNVAPKPNDDIPSTENHSTTSDDSDVGDFQVATDNVDEMEVEMEDQEPEAVQHMRDVFGIESDDDDELEAAITLSKQDAVNKDNLQPIDEQRVQSRFVPPDGWRWTMSGDERWKAVEGLVTVMQFLLRRSIDHIIGKVEDAQDLYREAKVKATAHVYERKAVIGGTMVGTIARLKSIMATKPFAIVCEEASEVLEPLLLACMSQYTVKLEMIGDHRQLKPMIMQKFDFERVNKINISLFERLIRASSKTRAPSTALSIQRRMRSNIADLTRDFYEDIVEIVDHDMTNTRKIGDMGRPTKNEMQLLAAEKYLVLFPIFSGGRTKECKLLLLWD